MRLYLSSTNKDLGKSLRRNVHQLSKRNPQWRLTVSKTPTGVKNLREEFLARKDIIDKADGVIVDATNLGSDLGGEIVYALMKKKHVLALIHGKNADELSPMLLGNPSDRLFIEHYEAESIQYALSSFLSYLKNVSVRNGKLIVIDGGDGSGKGTQAKLLTDYLVHKKIEYRLYDFPRYYTSFHGATIGRLLSGEFGELDTISPYLASLAYAIDRASLKAEMDDYLAQGGLIIANRYATSNMAHQGGRIKSITERHKFWKWLYELEYKEHKIPKEDLVIYLYVPWQIGMELTKKKEDRGYLKGKKLDIVEEDINYRLKSEEMFLELCSKNEHWHKIDCITKEGKMLSMETIHQKIIALLRSRKIIS